MDWTANYREIMQQMAEEQGTTYEELHAPLGASALWMVDNRLWRERYVTGPIRRLLGR